MTTASDYAWPDAAGLLARDGSPANARQLWLAEEAGWAEAQRLSPQQVAWLTAQAFTPASRRAVLVPSADGTPAGIAIGAEAKSRDAMQRPEVALGLAAASAPKGVYALARPVAAPELAAVAWGLGAYKFQRYKSAAGAGETARLQMPAGADADRVTAIVEGAWFGRDLINTPSNDLGPAELEAAARVLAARHGATVTSIVGDDLLTGGFNMIHAVGRASTRPPRLIELTWNGATASRRVALVGKGICFDTGGLDLKSAAGMLLMKKDMGGAATALALAHMIMATKLPVRLRVLLAVAENAVGGNAFRPGDVLRSRSGQTVEIGNTDAEGRLVLADALSLADEDKPDVLVSLATLTGAARTAVGPELAPFYCDDDAFAASLTAAGATVADPLWRMPFWTPYESMFESAVADMNNVSESGFAGSIIAALFLRKFVRRSPCYAHFDIYGWRPAAKPLGPKGAEVQAARALYEALRTGA